MANTYTSNTRLAKPAVADRSWDVPLNANADLLDALAPIGGLCVAAAEVPSASLTVRVAPGKYQKRDGTVGSFAGAPSWSLAASQTTVLYLTDSGALTASTSGYPAGAHVRLASVTTTAAAVASIVDDRVVCAVVGSDALPFLPLAGGALADGANLALGSAAGTRIGTSAAQKLGFWNAPPVPQPGPYTQAYAPTTRTLAAYTPAAAGAAYSGIASGEPGTPYAQASDLNNLRLAYENLRGLCENAAAVLNALINDLRATGLTS